MNINTPLLSVKNLHLSFAVPGLSGTSEREVLRGVSFDVPAGGRVALVGESGSGKSVTALAVLRLLDPQLARLHRGEVMFNGQSLLDLPEAKMRGIRGREIGMIFQEPMSALNPLHPVGKQIGETLMVHEGLHKAAARLRAIELLERTGIREPQRRVDALPHQLSGGQRQRVMIAMALACRPRLLIADEPTTALDVTVQAQIMTLLNELKRDFNTAIIMITHDLGVIAGLCDKVLVMYAGRTMEYGKVNDIFYRPSHPYTEGLLKAIPRLDSEGEVLATIPGNPPNLLRLPKGCPFQERCHRVSDICRTQAPELTSFHEGRLRACHWDWEEIVQGSKA